MNGPSPLNLDFDDTPFGGQLASGNPYQPLGASLDGFFLGGGGAAESERMELEEAAPSFLGGARGGAGAAALDEAQSQARRQQSLAEELLRRQRQHLLALPRPALEDLRRELAGVNDGVKRVADMVNNLLRSVLMNDTEVFRSFSLLDELKLLRDRLFVANIELGHKLDDPAVRSKPCAVLSILRQPFPCVFTKGKAVEDDDLQVQLVLSPCAECVPKGPVQCVLNMDPIAEAKAKGSKKGASDALSSTTAPLSGSSLVATLRPKFELGSRKTPATMLFKVQVSLGGQVGTVTSEPSSEMIIITNESQWEGSEGLLLKATIFSGAREVPWAYFANVLQKHFLIVTRQDPEAPTRPLSPSELSFLQVNLLGGKQVVDAKSFDNFWAWYGKTLQVARYQRHIGALWNAGLLLGFVSRQDVNNALHGRDPGTFLVRFSERHAGQFAVAYVGYEMPRCVKHYLVQPTDTASAKKTLPDFLSDIHQFQKILELKQTSNGPVLQEVAKDDALSGFLSQSMKITPSAGYDQLNFPVTL